MWQVLALKHELEAATAVAAAEKDALQASTSPSTFAFSEMNEWLALGCPANIHIPTLTLTLTF